MSDPVSEAAIIDAHVRSAFLFAQAAALNATVAGMQAENDRSKFSNGFPRYTLRDFESAIQGHMCDWNSALSILEGRFGPGQKREGG